MLILCCRSARSSSESSSLHPNSIDGSLNSAQMASPSDMVGPSPVTSNGTETTEIEDEVAEEVHLDQTTPPRFSGPANSQATVCAANFKYCLTLISPAVEADHYQHTRPLPNLDRRRRRMCQLSDPCSRRFWNICESGPECSSS
jgi:hypothetical protein